MTQKKKKEIKEKDQKILLVEFIEFFEGQDIYNINSDEFYKKQVELGITQTVSLEDFYDYRIKYTSDKLTPVFLKELLKLINDFQYRKHFDTDEELEKKQQLNLQIAKKISDLHVSHNLEIEHLGDIENAMADIKEIVSVANRGSKNMMEAVLITMTREEFGSANIRAFTDKYKQLALKIKKDGEKKAKA